VRKWLEIREMHFDLVVENAPFEAQGKQE